MKLSKRLKCISDMIESNNNVIDIGCDHGFLDIYLTKYKNCYCIASDVSENVLKHTIANVDKYNVKDKVIVVCSDGLDNIEINKKSIVVISGMGTSTILKILSNSKLFQVDDLIIQSNNEIECLRKKVVSMGFYIYDEKIVEDSNKYYTIIYFKRGLKKYSKVDYLFGPIVRKNREYSDYFLKLYEKKNNILLNIPKKYILKRYKNYRYLKMLKKFTCMK